MARRGSPFEFVSGLFRDWKPIAVIVVFLWSLFTLFQVERQSTVDDWEKLAQLPPQELKEKVQAKAQAMPDWSKLNTFEKDDLTKRLTDEGQLFNNIQILGKRDGWVLFTNLKLGLDLKGGSQLVLLAKPAPPLVPEITPEVMRGVETVIENRINSLGVSETIVQRSGRDRLIVELPGIKDPQQAKDRIGTTALLEFKEMSFNSDGSLYWKATGLTGADFKHAQAVPTVAGGVWRVTFEF